MHISGSRLLLGFPLVSLVAGVLQSTSRGSGSAAAAGLAVQAYGAVALILLWVWLDSGKRHYRRSWLLGVCLLLFTAFALPYYLFRSRGARGGFAALGAAVALFAFSMICYRVAALLGAGA